MRQLLLLFALGLPAVAQTPVDPDPVGFVTAYHGPPSGFGSLAVYEDRTGGLLAQPAWARELRWLPIDFVGRTALQELDPDRPRYRGDVAFASRLILPHERGTLLRYERVLPEGRAFGFLLLTRDGRPRRVLERDGTGALGADDPFVGRVAVAPDGKTLLVATRPPAGGDLLEVDLVSGEVWDRTPGAPPFSFSDAGLWLAHDWGLAVAAEGVLRFERAPGEVASLVPMPDPVPTWYSGQAVMSSGRTRALVTAGGGPSTQHVFVLGRGGAARRASRVASSLSGAGFLPESLHGPYMAVDDEGRLAAWRVEAPTSREARVARVEAAPRPVEVTADEYFDDTLEEVGQILSFDPGEMTLAVGERDVDGELESADLFAVSLDAAGQPVFENRTLSSGDTVPPFEPGTITPEVLRRLPTDGTLLIHDGDGERLLSLAPRQVGPTLLMGSVKEVYAAERAGDRWLFALRREHGNKPGELYTAALDLSGWTQLPGGGDDVEFADVVAHADGQVLLRAIVNDTQDHLLRADTTDGTVVGWQPTASEYQTPFAFTPRGAALFAQGPAAGPNLLRVWTEAGPAFDLQAPAGAGIVVR